MHIPDRYIGPHVLKEERTYVLVYLSSIICLFLYIICRPLKEFVGCISDQIPMDPPWPCKDIPSCVPLSNQHQILLL